MNSNYISTLILYSSLISLIFWQNLTPAADVDKAQTQLYLNDMDKTGMKPSNGNLLNDGHDNGMKGGLSVKNMYSSVIYYEKNFIQF